MPAMRSLRSLLPLLISAVATSSTVACFSADDVHVTNLIDQGDALLANDRAHQAVQLYQQALRTKKLVPRAHQRLGHVYALTGDLAAAINELQQAAQLDPKDEITHAELGLVLGRQGKYHQAIEEERIAVALNPKDSNAFLTLGLCLSSIGNYDAATSSLSRALELDPDNVAAYLNLGATLGRKGDYTAAKVNFERAIALDRDSLAGHLGLGAALAKLGEQKGAIEQYRAAVKLAPDSATAHGKLGAALSEAGDVQGAMLEGSLANGARLKQYSLSFLKTFLTAWAALFLVFGIVFAVAFFGSRFKPQPGEDLLRSFFLVFYKDKPGRFIITSRRIVFVPEAFSQWFGATRLSVESDQIESFSSQNLLAGGKLVLLLANESVLHFTMPNLVLEPLSSELKKQGIGKGDANKELVVAKVAARKIYEQTIPPGELKAVVPAEEELVTVVEYMPDGPVVANPDHAGQMEAPAASEPTPTASAVSSDQSTETEQKSS